MRPLAGAALALALVITAPARAQEMPPEAVPAPPPETPVPAPAPAPAPPPGSYQGAPPPAAPAPPPVRRTRYSRYRTSWYIGFALGGGGGWVSTDSGVESDTEGGVSLSLLRVGWVARPWMLLGAEISAWRHDGDPYWLQFTHFDLMATFFPIHDNGFLLKGGFGAGVISVGDQDTIGHEGRTDEGFDLRLGVGYEWQLLSAFNLGVEGAYSLTAHEGGRTHDATVQLTFTWY